MDGEATAAALLTSELKSLDERLRAVETATEVIKATMITWKRLLGTLVAVATFGSLVFGTAVIIGDRLWGV
jgi:hypothetical protein